MTKPNFTSACKANIDGILRDDVHWDKSISQLAFMRKNAYINW